ncbi:MAG TPA: hypothetical protein VN708_21850 [Terriglobales bacterium]|nr:hypothetical protein [Terriglobales bacterium]
MSCRIAGIDVHKNGLAVVVADVESCEDFRLSGVGMGAILSSCERCLNGSLSNESKKP